jgi:hypothetical protein
VIHCHIVIHTMLMCLYNIIDIIIWRLVPMPKRKTQNQHTRVLILNFMIENYCSIRTIGFHLDMLISLVCAYDQTPEEHHLLFNTEIVSYRPRSFQRGFQKLPLKDFIVQRRLPPQRRQAARMALVATNGNPTTAWQRLVNLELVPTAAGERFSRRLLRRRGWQIAGTAHQ